MKIFSDQIVKIGVGTCDFCGKEVKDGIIGKPLKTLRKVMGEPIKIIDGEPKFTFFGYKIKNFHWDFKDKFIPQEIGTLICKECIKEFSKMIK